MMRARGEVVKPGKAEPGGVGGAEEGGGGMPLRGPTFSPRSLASVYVCVKFYFHFL